MQEGTDLFGEVPVTWPEVVAWVADVAGITPDSPRWLPYVRAWRVPEKIAQAKLQAACTHVHGADKQTPGALARGKTLNRL